MGNHLPRALRRSRTGILAIVALTFAAGCDRDPVAPLGLDTILVVSPWQGARWPEDGWKLEEVAVEDDDLVLHVTHPGGCEDHEFQLLAVGGFHAMPTMGPVGVWSVPLKLAHEDHGDLCEAASIREDLRYGLGPLREAFRDRFGDGVAQLWLRLPIFTGAQDSVTVVWTI